MPFVTTQIGRLGKLHRNPNHKVGPALCEMVIGELFRGVGPGRADVLVGPNNRVLMSARTLPDRRASRGAVRQPLA